MDYERGTAFQVFLDDDRGVTVMIEPDVSVTLSETIDEWRSHEPA